MLTVSFYYYAPSITIIVMQFLRCVAPNISYHAPTSKRMIRGVAVRLPQLLDYLDKHGINHKSAKVIRKKPRRTSNVHPE